MKKILALVLALMLVIGLSVPVFAAKSPNGQVYFKVVVIHGNDHKDAPEGTTPDNITYNNVKQGNKIAVEAEESRGKFDDWTIYKADGTVAVKDVDYKLLGTSTLKDSKIEIIPMATLVVAANYNGVKTQPIIINDEDKAPATGDAMIVTLSAVALIALCGVVVAKKQLAK